jgi:hypothetical protein
MHFDVNHFCILLDFGTQSQEIFVEGENNVASSYRLFSNFVVACSNSQLVDGEYYLKSFSGQGVSEP